MMTTKEHDSAVHRLDAGLVEQDRLTKSYHGAIGTSSEVGAYARLGAAGADVAAREVWLHWIDDKRYRGLNAGPYELLAESSAPAALQIRPEGAPDHQDPGRRPPTGRS
jgi:hypothetical protein